MSGELASKPISPQDAATMPAAENMALGNTQKGGVAAVMQSAAAVNERGGAVGHYDYTDVAREQGVTVTETVIGPRRIITETVVDQVVGQYTQPGTGQGRSSGSIRSLGRQQASRSERCRRYTSGRDESHWLQRDRIRWRSRHRTICSYSQRQDHA
ncbi:hypothetical protein CsSME_00047113 [Camellia sinensis var. sinensis]